MDQNNHRTFASDLRSLVATALCLSEYAAEHGDASSAAILGNVAALLDMTVIKPVAPMTPGDTHADAPVLCP